MVAAACLIAEQLDAALIVVETHSGRTATALSNQRGRSLILALANDVQTVRSMSLLWGVVSEPMPELTRPAELREFVVKWGRDRGLIAPGARIVLIRGTDPTDPTHNELEVYEALDRSIDGPVGERSACATNAIELPAEWEDDDDDE